MSSRDRPAGLAPRLVAALRLEEVLKGARFAPIGAGEIADPRDRALANRLVTTALRRHGHLDEIIGRLLDRGMPRRAGSFEAVLRLSLAQLVFLPELGDHSALYLAGEALRADGKAAHLKGLMNAVLRRAQAERETLASLPYELLFPEPVRRRWRDAYGQAALSRMAEALLEGAPLDLTLAVEDPELVAALGAEPVYADSVRVATPDRPVAELPGYAQGRWWVQDAAAALPARLIASGPGARVLDLCAAPGGKTAQLAKAGFAVTALDDDAERLDRLGSNLGRLGYKAGIVLGDATRYRPDEPFRAVLLDAPCTATGTFRRHPEVVWQRKADDIAGRVALQRKMIANAANCLAPGGVLVYCVCSLEPEEGEGQAAWVAEAVPQLEPLAIAPGEIAAPEGAITPEGWVRTVPGMTLPVAGTLDGFFVARFRRPVH